MGLGAVLLMVVAAGVQVAAATLVARLLLPPDDPPPPLSPGRLAFTLLWAAGGAVIVARFAGGLGAVTNLSDEFPWGLWVSFDVVCGVALSAGGFITAGTVHVLGLRQFRPVLRPAILTAFLGYLLVSAGLMMDLGRPYNIWHAMIYWQHHSVLFEVAWCVMLYTGVLALEFLPVVLERFGWTRGLTVLHAVTTPLVIAGVVLSTLHQSSLGALFLIVPSKLLPLWYSPLLPAFFFLSALMIGLAMLIVESTLSSRAFHRELEAPVVSALARALTPLITAYVFFRIADVTMRDGFAAALAHPARGALWLAELGLLAAAAVRIWRVAGPVPPDTAYAAAVLTVCGVVLNRLNVSWLGLLSPSGRVYMPSWQEVVVTLNLVSYGVAAFALAVRYLPVYAPHGSKPAH